MAFNWIVQGVPRAHRLTEQASQAGHFEHQFDELLGRAMGEKRKAVVSEENPRHEALDTYRKTQEMNRTPDRPALRARDIMTRSVLTVEMESPVPEAIELMAAHQIRHLPVVGHEGELRGVLSDRDLFRYVREKGAQSHKVSEIMNSKVLVTHPDTPLQRVAGILLLERINALPVLNEDQKLVGILTTSDILRGLWKSAPLEVWT